MSKPINRSVLMSGVDYFDDQQAINPFMDNRVAIDRNVAAAEHERIKQALESAGVKVTKVTPPKDCQDGVYTANWALVRGNKAVMSRLPNARRAEEAYAARMLSEQGMEVIYVPEKYRFSGQGDALPCGDYLFCGQTYRSDLEAQQFAAEALGYERIQLQTVPQLDQAGQPVTNAASGWPDSFFYDIDLSLAILKWPDGSQKGLVAWCPAAFTPESQAIMRQFDGVDKLEVSMSEATNHFACNLISTGETVIMNAGATQLARDIEAAGLTVIGLHNEELAKGGGSIRCTTLTLDTV